MKKRNRKMRKALLMVLCALTLVAISVGATIAYLTDTQSVTNTFTVGHVDITLDEVKTDAEGKGIPVDSAERISGVRDGENYTNIYHLLPGQSYTKDPTVTVGNGSEDTYVVAKIEVSGIGGNSPMVANNLLNFGGIVTGGVFAEGQSYSPEEDLDLEADLVLKGEHTIYGDVTLTQKNNGNGSYTFFIYFEDAIEKTATERKLVLFNKLNIPGEWTNQQIAEVDNAKIEVTAYGMQATGFDNVFDAFETCDGQWIAYDAE